MWIRWIRIRIRIRIRNAAHDIVICLLCVPAAAGRVYLKRAALAEMVLGDLLEMAGSIAQVKEALTVVINILREHIALE
jgi:hypothetical protein